MLISAVFIGTPVSIGLVRRAHGKLKIRHDLIADETTFRTHPPDAALPLSAHEDLQPQSLQPSEASPPSRSPDEPDPRAVIDWLLKERR
jgi:hypothetical protein